MTSDYDNGTIDQPERVRIGHCPECGRVVVAMIDRGAWPLVECMCKWEGDTLSLVNTVRLDLGWLVSDVRGERIERRPK